MTNEQKIMAANDEIKRQAQKEILSLESEITRLRSKNGIMESALYEIEERTRRAGWNEQDDVQGQIFRIASVANSLTEIA
jgi:hypothetical protein